METLPEPATWAALSAMLAAATFGVGFMWRARREFVGRDECDRTHAHGGGLVTKEELRLLLDPIRREQEHRASSMDKLGQFVARMERRWHRMDLTITAIATRLDVKLPKEEDE